MHGFYAKPAKDGDYRPWENVIFDKNRCHSEEQSDEESVVPPTDTIHSDVGAPEARRLQHRKRQQNKTASREGRLNYPIF